MATKKRPGLLQTFQSTSESAQQLPVAQFSAPPSITNEKKRKKQLVFLVTDEQETRLTHLRADLGNIKIQALFTQALNMLMEKHGQPPL